MTAPEKSGGVITAAFAKAKLDRAARQLGGGPKVREDVAAKDGRDWRRRLVGNGNGPIACEANIECVLRHAPDLAGRLRFNEMAGAVECSALPWRPCEGWRAWTDVDDTALAVWCQRAGITVKPATCANAVALVAFDHPHHPVREYLDGLRWDGTSRLDTWLFTYLGAAVDAALDDATGEEKRARAAKNAFIAAVGRKWLISAVARACRPGCKVDHALILEGPQEAGKSSALAGPGAGPGLVHRRDQRSRHQGQRPGPARQVDRRDRRAERDERPEVERVKAFLSRAVDHYRPSYGRRSQDFPRQCVFAGTTNSDVYLADETGNRRFWPVRVGAIELDELRAVRDQLWAEAVAAFGKGEDWWLGAEMRRSPPCSRPSGASSTRGRSSSSPGPSDGSSPSRWARRWRVP
jgi:hypothetical protein